MDKGSIEFGLVITGVVGGGVLLLLGLVYGVITVAKWAWGS